MHQFIKTTAATLALLGAFGLAQAQSGGSGTGAPGNAGSPSEGTSPTSGSNAGTSTSKSSPTANTGNSADTGAGVRSSPDTSGTSKATPSHKKHSHAKRAKPAADRASEPGN